MIAQQIRIRPANPPDRRHILQVNRITWEHSYAHIFSQDEITGLFRNLLQQHGSWVYLREERLGTLVAEVDGKLVGFIGMASLLNSSIAEITTFYVLPDYQSSGIGKRLWQAALRELKNNDYTGTWVWVLEKAAARHFYVAQGCVAEKQGVYRVGRHIENAIGYKMNF